MQGLKRAAREDSKGAIKEVAKQFEAMFIQMMLKSMRDASFGDEIFGSQQMDAYQDMSDKQMALHLSNGRGIGLSDVIARQLQGTVHASPGQVKDTVTASGLGVNEHDNHKSVVDYLRSRSPVMSILKTSVQSHVQGQQNFNSPESFIKNLLPLAQSASEKTGIAPQVFIAQAALETGWGKAVIQHPDGKSSFNLFNIKADSRWEGDRVLKSTIEFKDGIASQQKAAFRSYDSFDDSFADYISFVSNEPRYKNAMDVTENDQEYITALHAAGYATDPQYSDKVIKIMNGQDMNMARIDSK